MKEHKISLIAAILMSINIMLGSGILIGPGDMARIAGNASFIGWMIVALLFLPIVLSTVQLSRMCPGAGGFYAYAKEGLNAVAGFWSGWLYITGYTFAIALEILALRQTLLETLGDQWTWFTGSPVLFNFTLASIIVGLNLLGLKFFTKILGSLTISKIIPVVTLILLLPFIISPTYTISVAEVKMIPSSLSMAIFGFFGFEYCCSISHLIENSERNAPLAILLGFSITALLYTLFSFGALNLMGSTALAEQGASVYAEYLTLPIPYLKELLRILIPVASAITLFAAAAGLLNANSVMLHAMAEQRLVRFWPLFARLTPWFRPWVAMSAFGLTAFTIATLIPNRTLIANICNIGICMSFIMPFISLMITHRRKGKHGQIPLPSVALAMIIGLVGYSVYSLGGTMAERAFYSLPFFGAIAIGAFLYKGEDMPRLL